MLMELGTMIRGAWKLEIHIGVYRPGVESKHPLKNAISQKVTTFFGRFFRQVADML